MNTQLLKGAFIVALLSIFSGFAMAPVVPAGSKTVVVKNQTTTPMFMNFKGASVYAAPNSSSYGNVTPASSWDDNPDPSSPFTKVLVETYSKDIGLPAFGTANLLMNDTQLEVNLNIGSISKTYNFDITGLSALWFIITVADDSSKPAGNFEKSIFELQSSGGKKILSEEEKVKEEKMRIEHGRLLGRPEIQRIKTPEQLLPMLPRK